MSEHLTHIAVYDDMYRIIQYSDEIHEAFKISLQNEPDAGLMASGARGNHIHAVPFIEQAIQSWPIRKEGDGTEARVAAAIGWLAHRAIDIEVKSRQLDEDTIYRPRFSKDEQDIYQDAVTFAKVYQGGKNKSVSPRVYLSEATLSPHMDKHPAAHLLHVNYVESLAVSMVQQNLMAYHSFHENSSSLEDWLDEFPNHYQKLSENLETYIEAYQNLDPKKRKAYIEDLNFYNEKDDIIRLARDLQNHGKTDISLIEAVEKSDQQSSYALGLGNSFRNIKAASDFFSGKLDKDSVYDIAKVDQIHRF
ncbi:hypothetical protein [Pleomorphovibrio marinus]|uniref:hypothetical protein n=1 Tax=Pleomorphovibrio marinus TaxID=2164132 RepID=UPI000E0A32C8|nr:hypothetical protein [Pleomorphovibrio marinus]